MVDGDVTASVRRQPVRVSGPADDQEVEVSGALTASRTDRTGTPPRPSATASAIACVFPNTDS